MLGVIHIVLFTHSAVRCSGEESRYYAKAGVCVCVGMCVYVYVCMYIYIYIYIYKGIGKFHPRTGHECPKG